MIGRTLRHNIECASDKKYLPVHAHLKNTFGSLLNDALYDVERTRAKYPTREDLQTVLGSVKYIAEYLLANLPQKEKEKEKEKEKDSAKP